MNSVLVARGSISTSCDKKCRDSQVGYELVLVNCKVIERLVNGCKWERSCNISTWTQMVFSAEGMSHVVAEGCLTLSSDQHLSLTSRVVATPNDAYVSIERGCKCVPFGHVRS